MRSQEPPNPLATPQSRSVREDDPEIVAAYRLTAAFVSADLEARDFERAISADPSFSALLGEDLYLDLLSSNFDNAEEVKAIRSGLAERLDQLRPMHSDRAPAPEPSTENDQTKRTDHDT